MQTFMEWETIYSKDAKAEVTQDSKYKKLEGFKALRKFLSKKD